MEKLTWQELNKLIDKHNEENNIKRQYSDKDPLWCVVVVSEDSFSKKYSLEERSYEFRSDEKYFLGTMLGNSIFARALDGADNVRLDWYLGSWKFDYCYIKEKK